MSVPPEVLHVVGRWIEKAERDLIVAEHLLTETDLRLAESVCFHAQQCIEKYIKGVLALHDIDPPKSHDIGALAALLPDPGAVMLTVVEQRNATKYATVLRYPGDYEPITLEEARAAVEMARRARASLRTLLPPAILVEPEDECR